MAERRMFAKAIIDSDAFIDMPLSAQALYFHLSMRADDEGFVGNPSRIQKMIGASKDDFTILVAKRFVLTFDSGIIVIKHWKIHNYIQSDRFHPTTYIEEKQTLALDAKNSYTERVGAVYTGCIQDVSKMYTEVSIDKDSIDKVSIGEDTIAQTNVFGESETVSEIPKPNPIEERFERFWKVYPKKTGKGNARNSFMKIHPSEELTLKMIDAVQRIAQTNEWRREGGKFIPYPATWLNQCRWEDETRVRLEDADKPYEPMDDTLPF